MRKFLGMMLILLTLLLYAAGAAALGRFVVAWPQWMQFVYFAVAGVLWVIPFPPVLRWMMGRGE